MVTVNVRVDQEADGPRIDASDRCQHLVADLQVLRIDHEDTVGTSEDTYPATRAVGMAGIHIFGTREHVQVRCDLVALDFDLVVLNAPLRRSSFGHGG